jgi:type I restriction enzyme S subunit
VSHIDDLIKQYCPDGVQFLGLGEACEIETGKLDANAAVENGAYEFFTTAREISKIESFRWDTEALLVAGNANVGDVKYFNGKFEAYQRTYVLTSFDSKLLTRFVFHWISAQLKGFLASRTNSAAMTYIVLGTLRSFPIPVPPIEVQREIVSILDTFTQLEAELEAELEARRKQLSYLIDVTYTNSEASNSFSSTSRTLGELGTFTRGSGLQKSDLLSEGTPCIHYGQIHSKFANKASKSISRVMPQVASKLKFAGYGDIVLATTSEDDEALGKPLVWLGEEPVAIGGETYIFSHEQDPLFMTYFFRSRHFQVQKAPSITGTKVKRIHGDALAKISIALPPIDVQVRVGQALSDLDDLVSDISMGLPAEIEARRKQYEYYRDKLLTFKELDVA